jgi:hypothetical protein
MTGLTVVVGGSVVAGGIVAVVLVAVVTVVAGPGVGTGVVSSGLSTAVSQSPASKNAAGRIEKLVSRMTVFSLICGGLSLRGSPTD